MASRVSCALDPHACCAMSTGTEKDIWILFKLTVSTMPRYVPPAACPGPLALARAEAVKS
eukprot:1340750-Rhodomonas_salina.1